MLRYTIPGFAYMHTYLHTYIHTYIRCGMASSEPLATLFLSFIYTYIYL